jgi:hypothetical protein
MTNKAQYSVSLLLGAMILAGCGSTPLPRDTGNSDLMRRTEALQQKEQLLARQEQALTQQQQQLQSRTAELTQREAQIQEAARQAATPVPQQNAPAGLAANGDLLPPNAKAGECYARVYNPPKYKVVSERVLKTAESEKIEIIPASYTPATEEVLVRPETKKYEAIPATYKTVTERVLVKPATKKLVEVPAKFEKQTERILVKAGYTTWKKGTGPIQKIDESTGEIMCLVEVPPVYKNVTKTVQVAPATVREMEVPAVYKTVKKQVIDQQASTREIVIPAEYKTVSVNRLAQPAREVKTPIPAVYQTVERREMIAAGGLEWRSILCDTNITRGRIMEIQRALAAAGFNPGPIDGSVQKRTMSAVNAYQRANGLPVDKYLNIETVRALGVDPR